MITNLLCISFTNVSHNRNIIYPFQKINTTYHQGPGYDSSRSEVDIENVDLTDKNRWTVCFNPCMESVTGSVRVLYRDEELRQDPHIVVPRSTFTRGANFHYLILKLPTAEEFRGNETSRWSLWSIWQPMNWTRLPLKKPHQGWNYHKETWLDALGAKHRENKCYR